MTRKHTRRKIYALVDPITMAIEGAAITDTALLDKLRLAELSAIHAFSTGDATQNDWRAIADLCNIAQTMCDMGIGPEVLPATLEVEGVLSESHQRFKATGRIATTGAGLNAMRELAEWHDVQRTSVDRSTYERAIKRTADRIRSAHPRLKVLV